MTPARQIHPIVNNFYAAQIANSRRPPAFWAPFLAPFPPLQNQIQISQTSNRMQNAAEMMMTMSMQLAQGEVKGLVHGGLG